MIADLLRRPQPAEERQIGLTQYAQMWRQAFTFDGFTYVPAATEAALAELATACAPLATAMSVRCGVFSEARFRWQEMRDGRMGKLFGTADLGKLERPWAGAGSEHLLYGLEMLHSIYGNGYAIRDSDDFIFLDPCKTIIAAEAVMMDGEQVGKRLVGYGYQSSPTADMVMFLPEEVAHYRTTPDPADPLKGTSWMRAVLADASADKKMTGAKTALLDNSMVPGMVIRAEPGISEEQFEAAREMMRARSTGWDKVGRTLMLGAGFDVKTVGLDFKQLDLKALHGAGETRIAAAAGLPVPIAGFSEGLQGSALNAGNYGAARRRFADGTMRPMWRAACTAVSTLVKPPAGARLWYDESSVSFLQEDVKDEADIRAQKAVTIRQLVDAGYNPDSAAEFAQTGDEAALMGQHSGLYSVQLQEPGVADTKLTEEQSAREIAELIQKIYLGVGQVVTSEEARAIANRAGADLKPGPLPADPGKVEAPTSFGKS